LASYKRWYFGNVGKATFLGKTLWVECIRVINT